MNNNLLNILAHSNKDIHNKDLMNYLSGKLTAAEKHRVEEAMLDNDIMNDAVEGLAALQNNRIEPAVDHVNHKLKRYLQKKKFKTAKRSIKDLQWQYVAIAVVLVIILVAFILIINYLGS
jgi:anti-sigma factor RsiW